MNNLEQMKKRKQNLSIIIAILIVLNLLLILVFATTTGNEDAGIATYSGEEVTTSEEPIQFEGDTNIADVKTGANFTVALDSTGRVWAWGQNNKGQLGNGTLNDSVSKQPVLISENVQLTNVKQIDVGEYHAVALTKNNEVYVWGYNYFGQADSDSIKKQLYAQKVSGLEGKSIAQVEAGANFTIALTTSGELFGLGDSGNGQLGYYNTLRFTSIRNLEDNKAEKELSNIKAISAGYRHILALKNDGTVWAWGDTTGSGFDFTQINQVIFTDGETIKEIQTGYDVSMALSNSGKVYTWSLGGNPTEVVLPNESVLYEGTGVMAPVTTDGVELKVQVKEENGIAIVNKTYYIIDTKGNVFGWGQNNVGQIGNYNTSNQTTPQLLKFEDESREEKINHKINKLASSPVAGINVNGAVNYDTAYAINEDGYVLGWGYSGTDITDTSYTEGSNTGKLLGDGSRTRADYIGSISVKAITGNDIEVKVGNTKDLLKMLKDEGYITGGRVNLYKEALEGKVGEALTIKSINESVASYNKDTGIVTGKTVGTTAAEVKTQKNTIYINIKVVNDADVAFPKIETRNGYTVALKADGTVWAWGYKPVLGIEDLEHSDHKVIVPTQVQGLENVKDIAIGNNFVLVLKTNGKIYAWGQNDLGQLGNGTTTNSEIVNIMTGAPKLTEVKAYNLVEVTNNVKVPVTGANLPKETATADGTTEYMANGVIYTKVSDDTIDGFELNGNLVIKKDTDGIYYEWDYTNNTFKTVPQSANEIQPRELPAIKEISAGSNNSIALAEDGTVWAWGQNDYSQLGLNATSTYESLAKQVDLTNLAEETIKQVEAGDLASYILTKEGNVYACGYSGNYLCGNTNTSYVYIPTKINSLSKITKISAGNNKYAVAIDIKGKAYAWGHSVSNYTNGYPAQIVLQNSQNIVDIESTDDFGAIYRFADGTVGYTTSVYPTVNYSYTYYYYRGRKYYRSYVSGTTAPVVKELKDTILISGGNGNRIIAEADGTVWGCGTNSNGELGDRTSIATSGSVLEDITKSYISLNRYDITLTVGQTDNLKATYNYGFNLFKSGSEAIPMQYSSLDESIATVSQNGTITAVKSGRTYIEAKAEDGTTLRVIVNVLSQKEVVTPKVSVGNTHTVALKSDGTVWGFGNNVNGELGSTIGIISEPEVLNISDKITDIAAGDKYTLMLRKDGTVLAMGSNTYGQLGNNTKEDSLSTVTVQKQVVDADENISYVNLDNIEKISAIGYTSYALDKDGNIYIWGNNANAYATKVDTYGFKVNNISGNLILTEDGRVWKVINPTALSFVRDLEDITQISSATYTNGTGYGYNMALDGDGKVYAWVNGANYTNKATGAETTVPTQVVIPVVENEKIVDIGAGVQFAYAMSNKGNVYSWGVNASALGRSGSSTTPAKINEEKLSNIESIAATTFGNSTRRAFAVTKTGSVYGFGANGGNSLIGTGETDAYYYEPKLVGESYAGFIVNGVPTTRLYMNTNEAINIQASLLDAFNLRIDIASTAEETDFEWTVFNSDLVSVSGTEDTRKITSNTIIGEATIVATDKISGKTAKLFIEVKPTKDAEVAPKIESTSSHTVSLKADGTVWVWGTNNNGVLGLDSTENGKTIKAPEQARIAKRIMVSEPILKEEEIPTTPDVDVPDTTTPSTDTPVTTPTTPSTDTPVSPDEPVEEVKPIYLDEDGNEYYKVGDNYTNLDGKLVIRKDNDDNFYKWNYEQNRYELEDLTNEDGSKIVVTDIATSNNHTLLLTKNGDVYSFGYNRYGQLGYYSDEKQPYQYLPKKVNGLKDIVKIAAGDNISLALDKYGRLWACGFSQYTTGSGKYPTYHTILNTTTPVRVKALEGVNVVDLAKSAIDITNEYILTNEGTVKALKLYGTSLATGTTIEGIDEKVIKVTRTSGSQNSGHTAFLTESGKVYTIGSGAYGQLGNGERSNSSAVTGNEYTAVKVQDTTGSQLGNIRDVYVGETHTIAIDKAGKLYSWGSNTYGELRSTESTASSIVRAYKVEDDERITNAILVSAGNGYSIAVDETGFAYAWGLGTSGQLGNALGVNSRPAVRVGVEGTRLDTNHVTLKNGQSIDINGYNKQLNLIYNPGIEVRAVEAKNTSIATANKNVTDKAKITVTGRNAGITTVVVTSVDEDNNTYTSIIHVTVLPTVADIADDVKLPLDRTLQPKTVSGYNHTLILKSDGTVLAYGDNTYGQTAGTAQYSDRVSVVKFPDGAASIIDIAAGDYFSMALDRNGNVYTWGNGNNTPAIVPSLRNIVKIAAGAKHYIALDKDGYVYTCGTNTSGSLGTGGTASVTTPVQVNNVANVIDIAAGFDHSMVLTADGSVYTTGKNGSGQLGVEYIVSKRSFEKINIPAKITYIEAGSKTSFAIDVDRNLWVWGNNADGQLGIGSNETQINIPTKYTDRGNIQSVSAGASHTQIVTTNGELYTAGLNDCGQLGVGEGIDKTNTFTRVSKLFGSNVMNSNAGETYSTVIDRDGKVYGFGDYNHGNADRVSRTNSYEPVIITNETSYIDNQNITLNIDGTYELNVNGRYKLNVLHKDKSEFTYESVNSEIAEVNENGIITGISVGTTLVRITDEDGKVSTAIVKVLPDGAIQAPTVEGGDKFAVVTDIDGTAYLFGNKENIIDSNVPKTINDSISFKTIKAGEDFIIGINYDGTVWTLGDNSKGQLGVELDNEYSNRFIRLNSNIIKEINQVDAGNSHAIALDDLGTVYVWGDNSNGQLSTDESIAKVTTPMVIRPSEHRVISVSAGGNYSAVVDTEGKVYIIGKAYVDIFEIDDDGNKVKVGERDIFAIQEVKYSTGKPIQNAVKVAVGKDKTIILTNTGSVYEVRNRNKDARAVATPKITVTNRIIVDIATNSDTFMALEKNGELYTWGNNTNGQTGSGSTSLAKVPTDEKVFTIGGGKTNTYYINTLGEVMAAGLNTSGELGNGTRANDNASTKEESRTYTKVGDREFAIKELKKDGTLKLVEAVRVGIDWTVLTGRESIKALIEKPEEIPAEGVTEEPTEKPAEGTTEEPIDKPTEEAEEITKQKLTVISEGKEFNAFGNIVGNVSDYDFELSNTTIAELEAPNKDKEKDYSTVTAKALGKTILTVKNKVTNEENELEIIILDDKKLRLEDIVVIDSDDNKFESEPNTDENSDIDFVIDVEGAKDSGTLNVTLELDGDKLTKAVDSTDTTKEYTIVLPTENSTDWVIEGLDLTKTSQTIILTLETEAGEEIEYKVQIRKETNVKVNDEVLVPVEIENVVTYTKFINPKDTTAKFEISILDNTKKIVLKSSSGQEIGKSNDGNAILAIDNLSVPEIENEFVIEITDAEGKTEKSLLRILKSSIESISVVDTTNPKGEVIAEKTNGTDGYVYNFNVEIDGSNKDSKVTLNIINKNVTNVKIDGVDTEVSAAVTFNSEKTDEPIEIELTVLDPVTGATYTEKYKLTIHKIGANTNIESIILKDINGEDEGLPKDCTFKFDGKNTYSVALHNKEFDLEGFFKEQNSFGFKVTLEDKNAYVKLTSMKGNGYKGEYRFSASSNNIADNKNSVSYKLFVTAENGKDTKEYTVVIYKESEDATIKTITIDSELSNGTTKQVEAETKDGITYIGKVVKNSNGYAVEIELNDSYAKITKIKFAGTEDELTLISGPEKGKYVYSLPVDKIGADIEITVQAEFSEIPAETYTLKTDYLDDNANFGSIKLGNKILDITENVLNESIKATDSDALFVKAESEFATVEVYDVDPATAGATPIASDKGEISIDSLGIDMGASKTVYIKVTSEDGQSATIKQLTVTRLSNNTNITHVVFTVGAETKEVEYVEGKVIEISDKYISNATNVKVKLEDLNVSAEVEGEPNSTGATIDLLTQDTINVVVTAEDGTVKTHTIKIKVLSSDTSILKEIQSNGVVLKSDTDFVQDETNENAYSVEVKNTGKDVDLVVKPNNATVRLAITSVNDVAVTEKVYAPDNKIAINTANVTDVEVEVTAEDGTITIYTITVVPEDPVLSEVKVIGNGATIERILTSDELKAMEAEVRVHPNSNKATIYLKSSDEYTLKEVTAITNQGMTDEDGIELEKSYVGTIGTPYTTVTVDLLDSSISDTTKTIVNIKTENGKMETLYLDIVRGSLEAKLDSVTVKGITTNDTEKTVYDKNITASVAIDSEDSLYNIIPATKDNGKYKLYKISDANKDTLLKDIVVTDSTVATEITKDSQVELTYENERFVIVVTAEFGGASRTYEFKARKVNNDTTIKDFKVTVNGDKGEVEKHLADFGEFDKDGNINIYVPNGATSVNISNLILSNEFAEAEWKKNTDINYTNALETGANKEFILPTGKVYIKVKPENGIGKEYCLNIKIATENTSLTDMKLDDITTKPEKAVTIEEGIATITEDTLKARVTSTSDNVIRIKVTKVNGYSILEDVATEFAKIGSNELELNFADSYTYKDNEGNIQTISKDVVNEMEVVTTVTSIAYELYPEYYDKQTEDYTLTIKRLIADTNIIITIDNGDKADKVIDTKKDKPTKTLEENGITVYEYTVKVPSTQDNLVINNVKAHNADAEISHIKVGNDIYTEAEPYTKPLGTEDKASRTEDFTVTNPLKKSFVYRLIVTKCSANDKIETLKLNGNTITDEDKDDIYKTALLSPVEELELTLVGIEENAKVEIAIAGVNGIEVSGKIGEFGPDANSTITKDLMKKLEEVLANQNITADDLNKISISIKVQPEDAELNPREYTLDIDVVKSNLISINGLNKNGTIAQNAQLTASDFKYNPGSGAFETIEIPVPSTTASVLLNKITCKDRTVITDKDGNVITQLNVILVDGKAKAIINTNLDGIEQQYIVNIRLRSTDTSIDSVSSNGKTSNRDEDGVYELIVPSTVDPVVTVNFTDKNAFVLGTKLISPISDAISTKFDSKANTFTVLGIKEDKHVDPSKVENEIVVEIEVQAEDGNTATHIVKLTRKHIEAGLGIVTVQENFVGQKEVNFANTGVINRTISSTTNGITITSAEAVCDKATVYVINDAGQRVPVGAGGVHVDIEENTSKSIKIIVVSEYGKPYTKEYTLNVRRQSANTEITGITVISGGKTTDDTVAPYEAKINVDENPEITVTTKATVSKAIVYRKGDVDKAIVANVSAITNNTFNITDLSKLYINDTTEDASNDLNRYIIVEITVVAEDTNVTKTYTLELNRRHIETGLKDISYTYTTELGIETGTETLNTKEEKEIVVSSTTTSIDFAKVVPNCKEARVELTLDGQPILQTEDGFSVDLTESVEGDGRIRHIVITVIAESDDIATYKVSVVRMATNASLGAVKVNDVDIPMTTEELPEGISGIFKANVKDSDKVAAIEAISANRFATVSIADAKYTSIDNQKSYDETGKYDLSKVTTRDVTITIVVTPQDTTKPTKTYQLILTRQYDSTEIGSVSVKPAVENTINTADIVKTTKDFEQQKYTDKYGKLIGTYYKAGRITVDTDWTAIAIGDLLPGGDKQTYTIIRISEENPNIASKVADYEIDSSFTMPEGTPVYFKIETEAESGSKGVYVLEVYKKATNTELESIKVDGKDAILDTTDGIYKVNVDVKKDKLPIAINGINNLSKAKTQINSITANGTDITNLLGQSKSGSGKTVTITLADIIEVLNKNKTKCSDIDDLDGKVITVVISVVPEDESITAKEYTVQITRQHSDETIKNIVLNASKKVTIKGIEYSAEQTVPVALKFVTYEANRTVPDGYDDEGKPKYKTEKYTYEKYEQTIQVTSALDTVTVNAINLNCKYAKGKMIVDGKKYTLPLKENVDISLPYEGASATIEIYTEAEDGTVTNNQETNPKYIILTRMSSDDKIRNIITQREYIAVDQDGIPYEENPRYETYSNDYDVKNNETYNIHQDAEKTVLTVYANNEKARITMELVDVLDRDGNSIGKDGIDFEPEYVKGTKSYNGYSYKYNIMNTSMVTFNTANKDARTFVINVTVQAEDAKNVPSTLEAYVPAESYEIRVVKQDNSAEISKIVEINDGTETDIPVDTEIAHYNFIGGKVLDKNIYTKYISADTENLETKVYAESKFAKVELYNADSEGNMEAVAFAKGTGEVTYNIETLESWTRIFVKITAEDGAKYKVYEVWFIKKSETDDVSISELYVDKELIPAAEDGNYYIEISDSIKKVEARLVPNYEYANVSINGQQFKWRESTETITNFETAKVDEFGRINVDLKVRIPAAQSVSGKDEVGTKTLFITRVSTNNGIERIETENPADEITPGDQPQTNEKYGGTDNTYTILLSGEARNQIDLTIVPLSPKATVGLYDLDGNLIEEVGTLTVLGLNIDPEEVTVYKVKVTPQEGEAKEYFIEIVPKTSQAELKKLVLGGEFVGGETVDEKIIGGAVVDLKPGVYEYHISNLGLTGLGDIYALAEANSVVEGDGENGSATVKIYTKDNPTGSGEQTTGEATLTDVDLDNTMFITITVLSPNKSKTNTYIIWLKDVDDDRSLQQITYTDIDGNVKDATPKETTKEGYNGAYEIVLDYDQASTDISITAVSELAKVLADGSGNDSNILTLTKDVSSMTEDLVIDIEVIAESNNRSKYELVIKKPTVITGKIITEKHNNDYSGVEVKFDNLDNPEEVIEPAITGTDGTYSIEVPIGNYNMRIEKEGYIPYTMTNIGASYGVRAYTGNAHLVAGDVYGNDGYIDVRDLNKVNKLARKNTGITGEDDTNRIYDLNEDGVIDTEDISIIYKNYKKKANPTAYIRMIEIKGNVLDALNGDTPLENVNITLREQNITVAEGRFEYENVPIGEYDLIVTNSEGKLLGQSTVTIVEGTEYSIKDNTITITPSTILSNITVRVNGTGAFISEEGKVSDRDFTPPTVTEFTATVKEDTVELTATTDDTTLGELANIKFYYVTTTEAGEEIETEIATIDVAGKTKETVSTSYAPSGLEFNKTYKFKVIATDKDGNTSNITDKSIIEVTDNVIRTEEDLIAFSNLVNAKKNKTYKGETVTLVNDLDLSDKEFTPIGKNGYKTFQGTFIGSGFDEKTDIGHTIKLNISVGNYAGLFGYTDGATIKNIGIEGTINSTGNYVGGIVGSATNTTIENCYNSAKITGNENVGGIVGNVGPKGKVVISNCYNSGAVTGNKRVGGIIGFLQNTNEGSIVENCYNVGAITGESYVGQIIGYRNATTEKVCKVENCYYIDGDKGIGQTGDTEEIADPTKPIDNVEGLLNKLNTTEDGVESSNSYKADFDSQINNGYPVLQWQQPPVVTTRSKIRRKESEEGYEELVLPVNEEYTISYEFGNRTHPVSEEVDQMHYGIDIAIAEKSEVLSIAEGTVTFAGDNGGYGYCIEIEHTINGKKVYSFYAHLSQIDVEVGEIVSQGQIIALSGGTPGTEGAGTSTGPHLHFEIRQTSGDYSSAVDPRNYLEF